MKSTFYKLMAVPSGFRFRKRQPVTKTKGPFLKLMAHLTGFNSEDSREQSRNKINAAEQMDKRAAASALRKQTSVLADLMQFITTKEI